MSGYTPHMHMYLPVPSEQGYGEHLNDNFEDIDTAIYDLQQATNPNAYVPTGCQIIGPTTTPPTGWLLCDGSEVSRSTYAALFAAIGTIYGTPSDTTKFRLPNKTGRVVVGADPANTDQDYLQGATGGQETVTLTENQMPAHNHGGSSGSAGSHSHTVTIAANGAHIHGGVVTGGVNTNKQIGEHSATGALLYGNTSEAGSHSHTVTVTDADAHTHTISSFGGSQAHENRMPYIAEFWWIKT